jgi:hypothetical protein
VRTGDHTGGATVRSFLGLSPAHVPEQLGSYGLSGQDGVVAYHLTYGWPMWVPPDPQAHSIDHPDLPPEVLAIQRYARGLGRDYVLFDADEVGDLPTWDW